MRFPVHFPASAAALALLLSVGGVAPADGAVTVVSSVARFVYEPAVVSKMYAALDPDSQVYLVVWSTFSTVAKGQFLDTSGRAITSPFQIAAPGGFARVVRGANEFLVTYSRNGQREGRSVKYVNGSWQLGNEFFITAVYSDNDSGMVYVPSAQHYLVTSWTLSAGYHSYVTGVKADGTITIPTTLVTGTATDTASPEIACDFVKAKCLMVGYGDAKRTWGRYLNPITGAMLSPLFNLDSGTLQEDQNIEWNAASQRFLLMYTRGRTAIMAKRIYGDGTIDPTAATIVSGGFGQLGMSYNPTTNSFLATFKDSAGNNQEYCWVQELDGNGAAVAGQLKRVSTLPTAGNAWPVVVANAARSEYLFVQTRNYHSGDAGVLGATTPVPGVASEPPPPPPPPPPTQTPAQRQRTAAKADFNGDLKADLLWQRDDGAVGIWNMGGINAIAMAMLSPITADPAWKIVGTGDLDRNGKPEIIWQNDDGRLVAWTMNGTSMTSWGNMNPAQVDASWRIVAVADLNGDARADLVFQRTDGSLAVWYMSGLNATSMASMSPAYPGDANWRVVGAGDMNNDGKPDLVFRHRTTGTLVVWFMNGATMTSWAYLTPNKASGLDWDIRAVIDLNGDGQTDLIWQNTSGAVAAWLMTGTKATSMSPLNPGSVTSGWKLAGPR